MSILDGILARFTRMDNVCITWQRYWIARTQRLKSSLSPGYKLSRSTAKWQSVMPSTGQLPVAQCPGKKTMSNKHTNHTVRTETYLREDIRNILNAAAIVSPTLDGDYRDGYMTALMVVATSFGIDTNQE